MHNETLSKIREQNDISIRGSYAYMLNFPRGNIVDSIIKICNVRMREKRKKKGKEIRMGQ